MRLVSGLRCTVDLCSSETGSGAVVGAPLWDPVEPPNAKRHSVLVLVVGILRAPETELSVRSG